MIESIKAQGNGWLVNGNKSVPNDPRNTDCQEVLAYIENGGIIEDELTVEELAQQAQDAINSESLSYLMSTDWRVIREKEVGIVTPPDIATKRQEARDSIVWST